MIKIPHLALAVLAIALNADPTAARAEFRPSAGLISACAWDAARLCTAFRGNMDGMVSCLLAKRSEVSPRCRAQYESEVKTVSHRIAR